MKTHMKKEVYDKVPQWIKEAKEEQYSIMVGDDIDSLTTAMLLRKVFGWQINWFYDFDKVYVMDKENKRERIAVDMALEKNQKTIDNHVTLLKKGDKVNKNSINMNTMFEVSRENYTEKYAMSTLLTAWSLLGVPLPKTDEGKMLLLAIDSGYLGHYSTQFRPVHSEWLRMLGFDELIPFLESKSPKDFKDTIKKYRLVGKILIDTDGFLTHNGLDIEGIAKYLELEIELPKIKFELVYELKRGNIKLASHNNSKHKDTYSFALIYNDKACYTLL